MSADLRTLIRDVLREELATLKQSNAPAKSTSRREEVVSIETDKDLTKFAQRILHLAQDPQSRSAIEKGEHVFRLARGQSVPVEAFTPSLPARSAPSAPTRIERGLVTEKTVASLPEGQRSISVGKHVRFTPLARDELRRRNIRIERMQT